MKHIKSVSAKNFKGRTFTKDTKAVNVIVGPNGSGKTAIIEAIKIALLGYSPRHGKTPGATFGFAGSPDGATCVETGVIFTDGESIARKWKMEKGKIKSDSEAPPFVPPVLLDAREFLGKSGPEKNRFVFNQIDLTALGFTTDTITARLKKDVKVEEPSEASERTLNELVELVREKDSLEETTMQNLVEMIVASVKEKRDAAQAVVDSMAGTIAGTTQLRTQEGLRGNPDPEALATQRKALESALEVLAGLDQKATTATMKAKRKKAIEDDLSNRPDKSARIAEVQKEHDDTAAKIAAFKSDTNEIAEALRGGSSVLAGRKSREAELHAKLDDLNDELSHLAEKTACPFCKSKGIKWRESREAWLKEEIEKAEVEHKPLLKEIGELQTRIAGLETELAAAKKQDVTMAELVNENAGRVIVLRQLNESQSKRTGGQSALAEIGAIETVSETALAKARSDVATLRTQIGTLETTEREEIAAKQDALRVEQARAQHADKTTEVEVYKLALKILATIQAEMMDKAFGGFMDKVNLFGDGILPGRMVYREGEIGYFAGPTFVSLGYLSGTEELLTFAGLSIALAQSSPFKVVVMDELGRMTMDNRLRVLERVCALVAEGTIDQFFGIDVEAGIYEPFKDHPMFGLITTR